MQAVLLKHGLVEPQLRGFISTLLKDAAVQDVYRDALQHLASVKEGSWLEQKLGSGSMALWNIELPTLTRLAQEGINKLSATFPQLQGEEETPELLRERVELLAWMRRNVDCHMWHGVTLENMGNELRGCYLPMLKQLRTLWEMPNTDIEWSTVSMVRVFEEQLSAFVSGSTASCPAMPGLSVEEARKVLGYIQHHFGRGGASAGTVNDTAETAAGPAAAGAAAR
jgi:hypothetical protein